MSGNDLPDNTPLDQIKLPTRLRNALAIEGVTTVGDVRDLSDDDLRSFQNLGETSIRQLRSLLGPPRSAR